MDLDTAAPDGCYRTKQDIFSPFLHDLNIYLGKGFVLKGFNQILH